MTSADRQDNLRRQLRRLMAQHDLVATIVRQRLPTKDAKAKEIATRLSNASQIAAKRAQQLLQILDGEPPDVSDA